MVDRRVLLHGACPVCGKRPLYCVTSGTMVEEDCSFVNGLTLVPEMPLDSELLTNWIQATWGAIKKTYEEQAYCSRCDKLVRVLVTESEGYRGYALSCGCAKTNREHTNFGKAYLNWRNQVLK